MPLSARAVALLCVLGTACPQARPAAIQHPPRVIDTQPPDQVRQELEDDLRATILEGYRALSGGYEEAYLDGLAQDARLVLIDVEPTDVVVGYEPSACRQRSQLLGQRAKISSKLLAIHLSQDLKTAWTSDEISYRLEHNGRYVIIPLRATGVYERRQGRWLLLQEHVSYGVPDDEAFLDVAAGMVPAPAALGDDAPPGRAARAVLAAVVKLIDDGGADRAVEPDLFVLGSDPDRELKGDAAAPFATARAMYGNDMVVEPDGLRIQLSSSGSVAWAAANLVVSGTRGDQEVQLPLRATWVLEKRGSKWRMVQMHLSVPVSNELLSRMVFGDEVSAGP